jgi:hypothetical protein
MWGKSWKVDIKEKKRFKADRRMDPGLRSLGQKEDVWGHTSFTFQSSRTFRKDRTWQILFEWTLSHANWDIVENHFKIFFFFLTWKHSFFLTKCDRSFPFRISWNAGYPKHGTKISYLSKLSKQLFLRSPYS